MHNAAHEEKQWWALRVTYNRALMAKQSLDLLGYESYVPMQYREQMQGEERVKRLVPSIANLLFLHLEPSAMQQLKATTTLPLRYIMNRETNKPLIVPDYQMQSFMAVAKTQVQDLIYLTPSPGDFAKGERVRVMGGPFKGAVGKFVRFKGDRRVVVTIDGVVAVATTFIHPSLIEKITE